MMWFHVQQRQRRDQRIASRKATKRTLFQALTLRKSTSSSTATASSSASSLDAIKKEEDHRNSTASTTIVGTFRKKRPHSKVGIVFRQQQTRDNASQVIIDSIKGKFAKTSHLVPGLRVEQINGIKVESAVQAGNLVRIAMDQVILVAQGRYVETKRRHLGLPEGLALKQLHHGNVQIQRMACSTPKEKELSRMCTGQVIVSINGITPVLTVQQAQKLLAKRRRRVQLVLAPPPQAPGTSSSLRAAPNVAVRNASDVTEKRRTKIPSEPSSSCMSDLTAESRSCCGSIEGHTVKSALSSEASLMESIQAQMPENDDEDTEGDCEGEGKGSQFDDNNDHTKRKELSKLEKAKLLHRGTTSLHRTSLSQCAGSAADATLEVAPHLRRVVASLVKPNRLCDCGISFEQQYLRGLAVKNVRPSGLFEQTPIQAGDRLMAVNGLECPDDLEQVQNLLADAQGRITVQVFQGEDYSYLKDMASKTPERIAVCLEKRDRNARFGLSLQQGNDGAMYLHRTNDSAETLLGSIANTSALPSGSKLDRINGKPCPESSEAIRKEFRQSFPMLSFECIVQPKRDDTNIKELSTLTMIPLDDDDDAPQSLSSRRTSKRKRSKKKGHRPNKIATAKAFKSSQSARIGITLKQSHETNCILISAIATEGWFAGSKLKVGQKLVRINGIPCPNSLLETSKLIKETTGTLCLEAMTIDNHKQEESKSRINKKNNKKPACSQQQQQDDQGSRGTRDTVKESIDDELPPPSSRSDEGNEHSLLSRKVSVSNDSTLNLCPSTEKDITGRVPASFPQPLSPISKCYSKCIGEERLQQEAANLEQRMSQVGRCSSLESQYTYQVDLEASRRSHNDELQEVEDSMRDLSTEFIKAIGCTTTIAGQSRFDEERSKTNTPKKCVRIVNQNTFHAIDAVQSNNSKKKTIKNSRKSDLDAYAELVGEMDEELLNAYNELKQAEEESCTECDDLDEDEGSNKAVVNDRDSSSTIDYSLLSTEILLDKALELARAIAEDDEETVLDFTESEADYDFDGDNDNDQGDNDDDDEDSEQDDDTPVRDIDCDDDDDTFVSCLQIGIDLDNDYHDAFKGQVALVQPPKQ